MKEPVRCSTSSSSCFLTWLKLLGRQAVEGLLLGEWRQAETDIDCMKNMARQGSAIGTFLPPAGHVDGADIIALDDKRDLEFR